LSTSTLSPGAASELPGETRFQTAWRTPLAARHQAPLNPLTLQTSPGGKTLTVRRSVIQDSSNLVATAWRQTIPLDATPILAQYWFLRPWNIL